jgi:hypothetical protein
MRSTAAAARVVAVLLIGSSLAAPAGAAKDGVVDVSFWGGLWGPAGVVWIGRAAARLPNQYLAVVGDLQNDADTRIDWIRMPEDGVANYTQCESPALVASFVGLSVLVADGGDVLVAGEATTSASSQLRPLVARFDGADPWCTDLVTSWGDAGLEILDSAPACDTEDCRIDGLAGAQSLSGRLYALVESVIDSTTSRFFVVALHGGGHVDTSFASAGWAEVPFFTLGYLTSRGARLALDPQGRPLVLVTRINSARGDRDCVFVRFTANGAVDIAEPIVDTPDSDDFAAALAVTPDGAVFAGINSAAAADKAWLYERRPDGVWVTLGRDDRAITGIALQGDDKVLTVAFGTSQDEMLVNRFRRTQSGFAIDLSFGAAGNGEQSYDVDAGGNDAQRPVALVLSGGRPEIVGNASTDNGPRMFMLRAVNSYLFHDGFEAGNRAGWSSHTF